MTNTSLVPTKLFVYGTLLSVSTDDMGRAARARLADGSDLLGAATINGRLYDLGAYPGADVQAAGDGLIHGEVVKLADPHATFEWLDRYEGIDPNKPDNADYQRAITQCRLADQQVQVWVYVYRGPVDSAKLISNGRWPGTS